MENRFFEHPILNSPYEYPSRHWELDTQGQPTQQIVESRRRAEFITPIPALIPTKGGEIGVRTAAVPHLQSTVSLWYLHSASELQQSGDTGDTVASQQSSDRYGIEWANYYTPLKHLAFDFDLANSKALFTTIAEDDAAPASPGGKRVPEAVGLVISSGITLHDYAGFTASLRLRYFGPRDLTSEWSLPLPGNRIAQWRGRVSI
jgi:hypothetical protein